ncbi:MULTISPECIES: hypothetical protein [Pseudoalteromonas]|uniref:Zn-ribbon protein n=1 Tax=Pseudoalteromonas amylolytica TaxID=1859457 RepID=A0A1S1MMK8_9GAMM|nr:MULTISPECIES: hypothetical protein [Pseudoalteromonas]MCF6435707.1 hypothetical protein [Pseudoalteromonas sp. MMG022]OHU86815.1 hypothetical protein BFC16_13520 [Pseudoalteromonas sp. JW3]OHU89012.1 hypothetical protein BET10_19240 [Pseudoalteromonas amylolytica]
MAIVQCPGCSKSISNKTKVCPHCQLQLGELTEEQIERLAIKKRISKQQKFMNHSFLALILFLGGFLYMYWHQPEPDSLQMIAAQGAIAVGCVWYLVNRVVLIYLKKKK